MKDFYHKATGFYMGNPTRKPILQSYERSTESLDAALFPLILSASGWRKVFAPYEESHSPEISAVDKEIVCTMADAFADFVIEKSGNSQPCICLGMDSRHTGPTIAEVMIHCFISKGIKVEYTFIVAAPEIMAYTKVSHHIDAFCYISASHNPIGHNGVKFGLADGAVIGGDLSKELIDSFKKKIKRDNNAEIVKDLARNADVEAISEVYEASEMIKHQSFAAYASFTKRVVTNQDDLHDQEVIWDDIISEIKKKRPGVVIDMNGSARTLTIDKTVLSKAGIDVKLLNFQPRDIAHRIVPEGESLEPCRKALEQEHIHNPHYLLGYTPDNDGDRGNLVYLDHTSGTAKILEAQEVFALTVLAELAWLVYSGDLTYDSEGNALETHAVVVNGPTSMRIEKIASAFDVKVFRAEVGEANVVNLARELQDEGYIVRIMGEGSNGGNITLPATVRDPLNTVFSICKLLSVGNLEDKAGLYQICCEKLKSTPKADFGLQDIIDILPPFISTSAYEDRALLQINTQDHSNLKSRYESVFLDEWDNRPVWLSENNIVSYRQINYEGTVARDGWGPDFRSGAQRGGFKIELLDSNNNAQAYLWMRGSGTEPVFRVLVDVEGDNKNLEDMLLKWHTRMILQADQLSV